MEDFLFLSIILPRFIESMEFFFSSLLEVRSFAYLHLPFLTFCGSPLLNCRFSIGVYQRPLLYIFICIVYFVSYGSLGVSFDTLKRETVSIELGWGNRRKMTNEVFSSIHVLSYTGHAVSSVLESVRKGDYCYEEEKVWNAISDGLSDFQLSSCFL